MVFEVLFLPPLILQVEKLVDKKQGVVSEQVKIQNHKESEVIEIRCKREVLLFFDVGEGWEVKWRPLGESNPCCRDENPVS